MKYANLNNERIEPQKGIKNATCPICGELVIPRCGSKKIHHWAHKTKENCDLWWEDETEWHRQWKDNFPKECQEYIMYDDKSNEKHIADVRTNIGVVVEFQHSYMPPEEQQARENFYKNMVWVVDASKQYEKFKNNIGLLKHIQANKAYFYIPIDSWDENLKCFPEKWLDSSVPVIFDFGIYDNKTEEKYKERLWCIFPKRYKKRLEYNIDGALCGVCLKKEQFIERVSNNPKFFPNIVIHELEEIHKKFEEKSKEERMNRDKEDRRRKEDYKKQLKIKCEEEKKWRESIENIRKKIEENKLYPIKIYASDNGDIKDFKGNIYNNRKSMTLGIRSYLAKWENKVYNKNDVLMLIEDNEEMVVAIANIPDSIIEFLSCGSYNYFIRDTTVTQYYEKFKICFENDEIIYLTKELKKDLEYIKQNFENANK